jgi:hypothetical protein
VATHACGETPWQHGAACVENVHRECAQVDRKSEISKPLFKVMASLIVMLLALLPSMAQFFF